MPLTTTGSDVIERSQSRIFQSTLQSNKAMICAPSSALLLNRFLCRTDEKLACFKCPGNSNLLLPWCLPYNGQSTVNKIALYPAFSARLVIVAINWRSVYNCIWKNLIVFGASRATSSKLVVEYKLKPIAVPKERTAETKQRKSRKTHTQTQPVFEVQWTLSEHLWDWQ